MLERGIEIVDCVEFDPALREIDVALDLAFLAMDLQRFDERLARALVTAYREAGGEPGDDALLGFFAAQRALIRAKVALVRAGQVSGADAERRSAGAARLLELAGRLGWGVRLGPIAVVCGGAATGKSTLAAALAARSGARVLSSDVVRKELVGVPPTTRAPQSAYSAEMNRQTYLELGRRTAAEQPVVVDATFRFAADREAFAAAAGAASESAIWIECRAPAAVIARRAAARIVAARPCLGRGRRDRDQSGRGMGAADGDPRDQPRSGRHGPLARGLRAHGPGRARRAPYIELTRPRLGAPRGGLKSVPHAGRRSSRRRSWALSATTIVETLIRIAPTAGARTIPTGARTPAASGIATTL